MRTESGCIVEPNTVHCPQLVVGELPLNAGPALREGANLLLHGAAPGRVSPYRKRFDVLLLGQPATVIRPARSRVNQAGSRKASRLPGLFNPGKS